MSGAWLYLSETKTPSVANQLGLFVMQPFQHALELTNNKLL
ncbi:hypothetical protein VCHA29O37_590008 [Vibrio chagasii]|nr:hypothetical protein VCHA29O37_590008 [Vibrio chagasii]